MIALAPKIDTRTEARRLADIGPGWCIVARQPMDGGCAFCGSVWVISTARGRHRPLSSAPYPGSPGGRAIGTSANPYPLNRRP